jgi:hypothetical protein
MRKLIAITALTLAVLVPASVAAACVKVGPKPQPVAAVSGDTVTVPCLAVQLHLPDVCGVKAAINAQLVAGFTFAVALAGVTLSAAIGALPAVINLAVGLLGFGFSSLGAVLTLPPVVLSVLLKLACLT